MCNCLKKKSDSSGFFFFWLFKSPSLVLPQFCKMYNNDRARHHFLHEFEMEALGPFLTSWPFAQHNTFNHRFWLYTHPTLLCQSRKIALIVSELPIDSHPENFHTGLPCLLFLCGIISLHENFCLVFFLQENASPIPVMKETSKMRNGAFTCEAMTV
jgi:hypothetical protein